MHNHAPKTVSEPFIGSPYLATLAVPTRSTRVLLQFRALLQFRVFALNPPARSFVTRQLFSQCALQEKKKKKKKKKTAKKMTLKKKKNSQKKKKVRFVTQQM
eukprot:NODE_23552_length_661_cov_2.928839.p3 GENE.NODE_23552_length_661_cov_2.928839~~NODE_23552_length_661_cov_2.928839.p3  ORF type:complete len:102 (-),score=32.95 NODE_23552_length_661_cov_2.928839:36-341(-)